MTIIFAAAFVGENFDPLHTFAVAVVALVFITGTVAKTVPVLAVPTLLICSAVFAVLITMAQHDASFQTVMSDHLCCW